MANPLIIPILRYLREQNSACSIVDLVSLCKQDFLALIGNEVDLQIVTFKKNFFVMNALYQIQRDIQGDGFSLSIFPLKICLLPSGAENKAALATPDNVLAQYYLDWSNLTNITAKDVEALFSSFWQRYRAKGKVDAALTILGLTQDVDWLKIRQAYQKKIIICHPDKGGCAADFIEIREAYEVLSCRYRQT